MIRIEGSSDDVPTFLGVVGGGGGWRGICLSGKTSYGSGLPVTQRFVRL